MTYMGDFARDVAALGVPPADLQRHRVNTLKAAEIAGVSERTIYNWMRLGRVEYVRTPTGQVRIYADTLLVREAD